MAHHPALLCHYGVSGTIPRRPFYSFHKRALAMDVEETKALDARVKVETQIQRLRVLSAELDALPKGRKV
jgi:hypothetical protein